MATDILGGGYTDPGDTELDNAIEQIVGDYIPDGLLRVQLAQRVLAEVLRRTPIDDPFARRTEASIRAIADPATRIHAVNAAIEQHKQTISELAQITRDTVAELRATGASHAQIAEMLGVTRTRAQQLAAGAGQ